MSGVVVAVAISLLTQSLALTGQKPRRTLLQERSVQIDEIDHVSQEPKPPDMPLPSQSGSCVKAVDCTKLKFDELDCDRNHKLVPEELEFFLETCVYKPDWHHEPPSEKQLSEVDAYDEDYTGDFSIQELTNVCSKFMNLKKLPECEVIFTSDELAAERSIEIDRQREQEAIIAEDNAMRAAEEEQNRQISAENAEHESLQDVPKCTHDQLRYLQRFVEETATAECKHILVTSLRAVERDRSSPECTGMNGEQCDAMICKCLEKAVQKMGVPLDVMLEVESRTCAFAHHGTGMLSVAGLQEGCEELRVAEKLGIAGELLSR